MKSKLIDAFYEDLRCMILRGELRANERIVEQNLAERYKISRTPVREVINRLVSEGLLVSIPHLGTFVRQFSYREVNEIFEIRAELEGLAIRLATEKMSDSEIRRLSEIAKSIDQCRRDENWEDAYIQDHEFHRFISEHCGNSMLMKTLEDYDLRITCIYSNLAGPDCHKNESIVRVPHLKIAEAVRARDPKLADSLIKQHIRWAKSTLTS